MCTTRKKTQHELFKNLTLPNVNNFDWFGKLNYSSATIHLRESIAPLFFFYPICNIWVTLPVQLFKFNSILQQATECTYNITLWWFCTTTNEPHVTANNIKQCFQHCCHRDSTHLHLCWCMYVAVNNINNECIVRNMQKCTPFISLAMPTIKLIFIMLSQKRSNVFLLHCGTTCCCQ